MQLPDSVILGIFAGLAAAIPMVGGIVGVVPPVLLGFTIGPEYPILVLAVLLVIQLVDANTVIPMVMNRVVSLPALGVVLALLVGGALRDSSARCSPSGCRRIAGAHRPRDGAGDPPRAGANRSRLCEGIRAVITAPQGLRAAHGRTARQPSLTECRLCLLALRTASWLHGRPRVRLPPFGRHKHVGDKT